MVLILISFRVKYILHCALKLLRLSRRVRFLRTYRLRDGYSRATIVVGIVTVIRVTLKLLLSFLSQFSFLLTKKEKKHTHTHTHGM